MWKNVAEPAMVTSARLASAGVSVGSNALGDDVGEAVHEARAEPDRPGDVGDREGHEVAVALDAREAVAHAAGGDDDVALAVACPLGVGRGARRVEEQVDGLVGPGGGEGGRGWQRARVGVGQVAVHGEHVEAGAALGLDALGHGHVVEAAPLAGDDEELGAGLLGDEAHLAVAVDGDDGVLGGAETGQRAEQDQRLVPGGQHPRHHVALADAEAVEPGRGAEGRFAVAAEGDRPVVLVDGHHVVGRACGPLLDQLPEVATLEHARLLAVW